MKLWLPVCFLCLAAIASFSLDREAFTFTQYDLNIRIEPEQQRLAVRGRITLRNDSGSPQKNAVLQISSSLSWRSIQSAGKPLQFLTQPYESDVDHTGELSEAIVTLPQEVARGKSVDLDVGYEGVVTQDATRLTRIGVPKNIALQSDWDQVGRSFTAVRGVGYVTWYPVAMDAASLSDGNAVFETVDHWKRREQAVEMRIKMRDFRESGEYPSSLLCNGAGVETYEQMDGASLAVNDCAWSPLRLTVPTLVSGKYELLDKRIVKVYFLPDHGQAAENIAVAAEKAASFVTEWFGAARMKTEVVDIDEPRAAPFESGPWLLMPLTDSDAKLTQLALVHSLVHAAFPSPRSWIYEGLAHFAQALYRQEEEGRSAAITFMGLHQAAIVEAERANGKGREGQATSDSLVATARDEFYRSKAAYVWLMLRDMVGEQDLKRALASYKPAEDKEPSYLQRLLQAQSKRDLEWFFDDWVYRDRGLPDFRVASVFPRKTLESTYMTTVTVENLGDAGAEVPVTVRSEGGDITHRLLVRGKDKASIRFETPRLPTEVVVNDGSVAESDMSNNTFKVQAPAK